MIFAVDLLKPFTYEFFRNGLLIATLAGALCGLIGVFVVLRGMSYIGHGLSHAVFGGAALAAVLNLSYFLGAGLWGLASGLMIGRVARKRIIGADAAIGVITTASFAMGLALQARFGQAKQSIDAVLFGNVLGVFTGDILAVAGVGILSVVVVVTLYRKLLFATFDPDVAGVSGVNVPGMEAVLMVLLSSTTHAGQSWGFHSLGAIFPFAKQLTDFDDSTVNGYAGKNAIWILMRGVDNNVAAP